MLEVPWLHCSSAQLSALQVGQLKNPYNACFARVCSQGVRRCVEFALRQTRVHEVMAREDLVAVGVRRDTTSRKLRACRDCAGGNERLERFRNWIPADHRSCRDISISLCTEVMYLGRMSGKLWPDVKA